MEQDFDDLNNLSLEYLELNKKQLNANYHDPFSTSLPDVAQAIGFKRGLWEYIFMLLEVVDGTVRGK